MRPAALAVLASAVVAGCSAATPSDSAPGATSVTARPSPSEVARSRPPVATATADPTSSPALTFAMESFAVASGSAPHDVAPAADGGVWYTGQGNGTLGWLDPSTGEVREIALGAGSAPHGVVVGPDDAPWVTDSGLNAIVRVDPGSGEVTHYPLPALVPNANLNTATFDGDGILWFTGQNGWFGRLDPTIGEVEAFGAPRRIGPYGIATLPDGEAVYGSLAGSYLGFIDRTARDVTVVDTPTPGGGARRVWADSSGRVWVTEWFAGLLAAYDPATATWEEWPLPGEDPQPYAVYVDENDMVWVTDFGANAIHRFDPTDASWTSFAHDRAGANVRQLLGRAGEVWGAESGLDRLVVIRTDG